MVGEKVYVALSLNDLCKKGRAAVPSRAVLDQRTFLLIAEFFLLLFDLRFLSFQDFQQRDVLLLLLELSVGVVGDVVDETKRADANAR